MIPERTKRVAGKKVEEFYWAGALVVYVDNRADNRSFDDITEESEGEG